MIKYKLLHDRAWLYQNYVVDKLSTPEIGRLIGCHRSTVLQALNRFNIDRRDSKVSNGVLLSKTKRRSIKYESLNDIEWLNQKYLEEGLSTNEIMNLVGAKTPNSVRQALIRANINVRSISDGLTHDREDDGFITNVDVITGCLLGDAKLDVWNKASNASYPSFEKKNKFIDHIEFVGRCLFNNWETRLAYETNWCNGRKFVYPKITSLTRKDLLPIYRKWYPEWNNYEKMIPDDININEIILLHWFLDDGSTSLRNRIYLFGWVQKKKQVKLTFCTECFTKENQQMLCDKINDRFPLQTGLKKTNSGTGWRIGIPQSKVFLFYEIIGPPPVASLAYKWK